MAMQLTIAGSNVFFAKAFKAEEGDALSAEIAKAVGNLAGRRVVVIDHPPTAGLHPLLEGLMATGAEVHLRDHHADEKSAGIVNACRALLGERAIVMTRTEHPACSTLINVGEFAGDILIADADKDGVTAALKAAGINYPMLDTDAAVLDGPASGQTEQALSSLGFAFVRAWGAIPAFGTPGRDTVFVRVVEALASAAQGNAEGRAELDCLAVEYEAKVTASKELALTATEPFTGFRFVEVPTGASFDPPTLAAELDKNVLISGRRVTTGPIAKIFGAQVSLARTKTGETAGIDLLALAQKVFGIRPAEGWRPEDGVLANMPALAHFSPENWAKFRAVLEATLASKA